MRAGETWYQGTADAIYQNINLVEQADPRVVAIFGGDHIYRIKSPLEEHERVVQESLLVKSEGFLPEKALNKSSRRRSITLPTLRGSGASSD